MSEIGFSKDIPLTKAVNRLRNLSSEARDSGRMALHYALEQIQDDINEWRRVMFNDSGESLIGLLSAQKGQDNE